MPLIVNVTIPSHIATITSPKTLNVTSTGLILPAEKISESCKFEKIISLISVLVHVILAWASPGSKAFVSKEES